MQPILATPAGHFDSFYPVFLLMSFCVVFSFLISRLEKSNFLNPALSPLVDGGLIHLILLESSYQHCSPFVLTVASFFSPFWSVCFSIFYIQTTPYVFYLLPTNSCFCSHYCFTSTTGIQPVPQVAKPLHNLHLEIE